MQYADVEQLGPTQSLLTNGALLVRDVPIARTGEQYYHASEIAGSLDDDTAIDNDGLVRVWRDERDVFDPKSMASFEGASVVMRHPDSMVGPDNWRELSVGHVQHVRRSGNALIADLLIHDRRAINAIRLGGWRAVSAGYDARYAPIRGGLRQTDIRANHIAILAPGEAARCGDLCTIGDSAHPRRNDAMLVMDAVPNLGGSEPTLRHENPNESTGLAGPRRILKLPGPATAYQILADATGQTWLVQSSDIDGKLEPGIGSVGIGSGPRSLDQAMRREVERQRDAKWCGDQLRAINAANRRRWSNG
jgi:hypothetical protein